MSIHVTIGRLTLVLIPPSQQVAFLIKHEFFYKVTVKSLLYYTLLVLFHSLSIMREKDLNKYSVL